MNKLDKELSILFLSTGFLQLYLEDVLYSKDQFKTYEKPIKLLHKHRKICTLYPNKLEDLSLKAEIIFEGIEQEAKEIKPAKRFEKRIRFDEQQEVSVNGLMFACSLALEHRNIKNRALSLDYKLAENIYLEFEGTNTKTISNSKLLAKKFLVKLAEE